MIFALNIYYDN